MSRLLLIVSLLGLIPPATATDATPAATSQAYWSRQREGWFWYREPPADADTAEPVAKDRTEPKTEPSRQAAPPQPPATRPDELIAFDALQRQLEDQRRIAVMNPTDEHLLGYMRLQRQVMDRAQTFATRWQRLLWREPDLDYSLQGRPTQALAMEVFDRQQRETDTRAIGDLAATHGLVFFFRSDCPHCHRFAPVLRRFAQTHGLTVLAVSLDGGPLAEFPGARPDNGLAAQLAVRAVPALYLSDPRTREFQPVGFGALSDAELTERLSALAREQEQERGQGS
jgi:conjugal transfer pilus assembly protein TraF